MKLFGWPGSTLTIYYCLTAAAPSSAMSSLSATLVINKAFCSAQMVAMVWCDVGSRSWIGRPELWLNEFASGGAGIGLKTFFGGFFVALDSLKCRAGSHVRIRSHPSPLQLLLFPHGVDVWVVGEGSRCVSARVYVCMCVSVVVTPPPPHLSLLCFLTSSTPLCLSCSVPHSWQAAKSSSSSITWMESPPPPYTLAHTHRHTVHPQCAMEIVQYLAILVEEESSLFTPCCFSGQCVWLAEATARLQKWKCRFNGRLI